MVQRHGRRTCTIIGRLAFAAWVLLALAAPAQAEIVRAENYNSFWLWAGVEPQAALLNAKEIYLLAGEVTERGVPRVIAQRSSTPHVQGSAVWLV